MAARPLVAVGSKLTLHPTAMSTKLTKKQKKAAAFKDRKGKGRDEPLDLPALDDAAEEDQDADNLDKESVAAVPKPTTRTKDATIKNESKKRKREDDDVEMDPVSTPKRPKIDEGENASTKKPNAPSRYIIFVGKYSFTSLRMCLTRIQAT